jgi:hypothetical protein
MDSTVTTHRSLLQKALESCVVLCRVHCDHTSRAKIVEPHCRKDEGPTRAVPAACILPPARRCKFCLATQQYRIAEGEILLMEVRGKTVAEGSIRL